MPDTDRLKQLDKKINARGAILEPEREVRKELEIMEQYTGEDKVVPSKELFEWIKSQPPTPTIQSKIPTLDKLLGGFKPGQLITLSAPTGQGKTMFLQSLTHTFVENDINSLWFSYEVGNKEFFERFAGEVPLFYLPQKVKNSDQDWLERRIVEGIAKFNTKVVFIDHLHFLIDMRRLAEAKSISLLIGDLMRKLKSIAVRYEVVIFLVSHIRKLQLDKDPDIEDLRDSSFISQESDTVLLMWRNKTKTKDGYQYTNEARMSVAKNRSTGAQGRIKLTFNGKRFYELTDNPEPIR